MISAPAVAGQERAIVANQVEVSSSLASLQVEFSDGDRLSVTFADGRASVDGEDLGTYERGGPADRAWRALLANVLSLSNGPLARELDRWQPDTDVGGAEMDLLLALDAALGRAVAGTDDGGERVENLLEVVARSENIQGLGEALDDVDIGSLNIWLEQDHTVPEGTTVSGGVLLAGGHLDVRGRVRGDVIVLDGDLTLAQSGRIEGDVHLIDADMDLRGGDVRGQVVDVSRELQREASEIRDQVREEVQRELGRSRDTRARRDGFLTRVGRATGGIVQAVVLFVVVSLLTLLLTHFSGDRVDVVTQAVGHQPARMAAVGFAGGFLLVPVYIVGIVVLAVSVVGIIVLPAWVPLFPLAAAIAGFMGYVGVSHHVGRWVLNQDLPWLNWVDRHHPTHVKLVGVAALLAPFVAGDILRILPMVGWVGGLVSAMGTIAFVAAMVIGLGAVIMTRGGRRPTGWGYGFDQDDLDDPAGWSDGSVTVDFTEDEDGPAPADGGLEDHEGGSDSGRSGGEAG